MSFRAKSLWQVWFLILVDGRSLNGLVEAPINVDIFNSRALARNMSKAVCVDEMEIVSVDSCLKVYLTGSVSQLDRSILASSLSAAVTKLLSKPGD